MELINVEVAVNHGHHRRGEQFTTAVTRDVAGRLRAGYLLPLGPAAASTVPGDVEVTIIPPRHPNTSTPPTTGTAGPAAPRRGRRKETPSAGRGQDPAS